MVPEIHKLIKNSPVHDLTYGTNVHLSARTGSCQGLTCSSAHPAGPQPAANPRGCTALGATVLLTAGSPKAAAMQTVLQNKHNHISTTFFLSTAQ